jgi:4-amino-4-deoxy-L-arabinose transferase-like glycosyltransferase
MQKNAAYVILLLGLLLRLYHLDAPTIGRNSWRQSDTAAMARNFYENGFNFAYPQIDWGGNSPGYVETEFPLYPFTVALLYKIFGVHELLGRLLSAVCYAFAIYFLYLLVRKIIDESTALWASFFFSILPLSVYYGRNFFPEPMLIISMIAGVYFLVQWIDHERWWQFVLSAAFIALACLLKIVTLYVGLPILYLGYAKYGKRGFLQWRLWLYAAIVILPVAAWYSHAHQILLNGGSTFGIWEYGTDKWGNWNLVITPRFWNSILFQSLAERHFTWSGFPVLVAGIFLKRRAARERLFDYWLIALFVYVAIVARGNDVHDYYQLPFLIPGVVFMGKVFSRHFTSLNFKDGKTVALAICLMGTIVLGSARYYSLMKMENPDNSAVFSLAGIVQQKTEPSARIIVLDNRDPTIMYLSHRKGWHATAANVNESFIIDKRSQGARYLVGLYEYLDSSQKGELRKYMTRENTVLDDGKEFIIRLWHPRLIANVL